MKNSFSLSVLWKFIFCLSFFFFVFVIIRILQRNDLCFMQIRKKKTVCFASAQSEQRLSLFIYWKVSYLNFIGAKIQFLASLCSWASWFESCFVGKPKSRFCRVVDISLHCMPLSPEWRWSIIIIRLYRAPKNSYIYYQTICCLNETVLLSTQNKY